ncbi:MAG: hypothetical protein ACKVQT_05805 [Burkholderiales bacterium]
MSDNGQSCPPHYRYRPSVFRGEPSHCAETVYVIGGLYGNIEALHAIFRMQEDEARAGRRVSLVFNGDFNWFNVDLQGFREINAAVLAHVAIQGNVEAEIGAPSDSGCGCNYPDYVDATVVARSNAIMRELQSIAADAPGIRGTLAALPMVRTIQVGDSRIGIVHGDAEALAGWAFAAERLAANEKCTASETLAVELAVQPTPLAKIATFFREANVCAFASTHTCLPLARDFDVDGAARLVINNGAAGMPNFTGSTCGVITRISIDRAVPCGSLYGIEIGGVRFDALPVHYDQTAWVDAFLRNWPPGSPAHASYFHRIVSGPRFAVSDAIGGRVRRM